MDCANMQYAAYEHLKADGGCDRNVAYSHDVTKNLAADLFRKVFYAGAEEKNFESILGNKQLYALIIRHDDALMATCVPSATCALLATIRKHDSNDTRAISNVNSQELRWDLQASKVNLWLCCTDPAFQGRGLMFGRSPSQNAHLNNICHYSLSVFDEFTMKLLSEGIKYYRVATIERKYPIMYKKLESMNHVIRFQVQEEGETKTVYFMKV